MGKKKNDGAGQDRSASRNGLPFIQQLPIFLIVALITPVLWLFQKLLNLGRDG